LQKTDLPNWQSKTNRDQRPKIITSSPTRANRQGLAASNSKLRIIMERVKEPIQLFTTKKLDIYSRDKLWRQLNHRVSSNSIGETETNQSYNVYESQDFLSSSENPKISDAKLLSPSRTPKPSLTPSL
jgi:hypothetical protein